MGQNLLFLSGTLAELQNIPDSAYIPGALYVATDATTSRAHIYYGLSENTLYNVTPNITLGEKGTLLTSNGTTSDPLFAMPEISWDSGTTTGPTLRFSINEISYTSTIPSASSSASGIVTNGTQTFGGNKTFNDILYSSNILPRTTKTYNLGSTSAYWNNIYNINYHVLNTNGVTIGKLYPSTTGTTTTVGYTTLELGNNKASTVASNSKGKVRFYTSQSGYIDLVVGSNGSNSYLLYLPYAEGELVYHTYSSAEGSSTRPVYIDSQGKATAITATEVTYGGTGLATVTKGALLAGNNTSAIFEIAPVAAGQILTSNGETNNPIYATPSLIWTDGTTAGPTLTYRLNNIDYTSMAFPSATDAISGIVTTGTQSFNGAKTFKSSLTVDGTVDFNSTVNIDGILTLNSTVTGDIIPTSGNTYNLGSLAQPWEYINGRYFRIYESNGYLGGSLYTTSSTSTSAIATTLTLGNGTASGTAGNRYGAIKLYSSNTQGPTLRASSHTASRTVYINNYGATAYLAAFTSTSITANQLVVTTTTSGKIAYYSSTLGDANTPIYLNAGIPTACTGVATTEALTSRVVATITRH